jgi:TRAP-type uncharacterized transport system substrate-binding protein
VADLKGKRVALDEPGSGTLINARAILAAYGLKDADLKPEYIKPNQAGDKLKDGSLDAFFYRRLARGRHLRARLRRRGHELRADRRCAGRRDPPAPRASSPPTPSPPTPTRAWARCDAGRGAQWVTSDKVDANLVYEIVKALFSAAGQKAHGRAGHAKGKFITKENAVQGAGIPFHPGAARYYREVGVLK